MSKPIALVSAALFVSLVACKAEGYDCTATFTTADMMVVSTMEYDSDASNADEAVDMCLAEAAMDKPAGATHYNCECESR